MQAYLIRSGCPSARSLYRNMTALALVGALLVALLAGCAGNATGATTAATRVPQPTDTPARATAQIADLGQFRQRLADAMASRSWDRMAPLISPAFSFQTALDFPDSQLAGRLVLAPDAAPALQKLYTSAGGWSQNGDVQGALGCYGGGHPADQLMGFSDGGTGWLLLGFDRWQGYWLVSWAYQDSTGWNGRCLAG